MGFSLRKRRGFLKEADKYKGFTLIELMITIGIIGVLATIGLNFMNQGRKKAYDAETIAQLSAARTAAQLFFEAYGNYKGNGGNVANRCNTNNSMFVDVQSGMLQYTTLGNYPPNTSLRCSSNPAAYQISASLSTSGEYWCVNNQGLSKKIYGSDHADAHPNNDTDCIP